MNASGDTTSVWADMYNQMGDVMTALANVNATQSANSLDDLMKEGMYGKKLFTKPPNGTNAFITSSIFNSCIFLGGVLAFSMLRRKFPGTVPPQILTYDA
ncbi:hypothetical protein SARC_01054 [Sphaeroforma arctica JP610]|uniref:Uncharacterized protein n=1 Tax=Sphaeroforma arctica JP610 TaxID=667725 RepID=A0A0L0GCS9_9EUKA|nr:hypothetical protein SARC_01054 [Sphaeroforma arctica JP610]KNC86822.1 hypothetical protein SARC_01054 [Sphaeroforma arctica JP610]|eukprot:XP_014160724.1 hypothetical protein SARC_01054 [Sphaeroforma arctica JP610]